ncbi:MAG: hypothetical protein K5767_06895, partial [Clostridia bacterium]|nr:hypothetical protein [Clostridia bacterium]
IKEMDAELTDKKEELAGAQKDNKKYKDSMLLVYKSLSGDDLSSEVDTVDGVIGAVQGKAAQTAADLKDSQQQNKVNNYKIENRSLVLEDINTLIAGGEATAVDSKITALTAYADDEEAPYESKLLAAEQLTDLKQLKNECIDPVVAAMKTLADTKGNLADKQAELSQAQHDISDLTSKIISLNGIADSMKLTIENNEKLIASLKKSGEKLAVSNEKQSQTISNLEGNIETLESLSATQSEQIASLNGTISEQQEKIDDGTATISELTEAVTTANAKIAELTATNNELVAKIAETSEYVDSLRTENDSQKTIIDSMRADIESLGADNSSLLESVKSLKEQLAASETAAGTLKESLAEAQALLDQVKTTNDEQATQIASLTETVDQYKNVLDVANTLLGLSLTNTSAKEDIETALKSYVAQAIKDADAAVNKDSETYKKGYNDGLAAGKSSSSGSSRSSGGRDSSRSGELREQISALTASNEKLTAENKSLTSENARLKSDVESLTNINLSLQSSNSTLMNKCSELESSNEQYAKYTNDLKTANTLLEEKANQSSNKNAQAQANSAAPAPTHTATANKSSASTAPKSTYTASKPSTASTAQTTTVKAATKAAAKAPTNGGATITTASAKNSPKVIAGTNLTSDATMSLGTVLQRYLPTDFSKDKSQRANVTVNKLSDSNRIKITTNAMSSKDSSDEELNNAYKMTNYYANNLKQLGQLGSEKLVKVAGDANAKVVFDVVASENLIASNEQLEAVKNGELASLTIKSDSFEDGDLYFAIHQSENRSGIYDVLLVQPKDGSMTMELPDLSPVTLVKVSVSSDDSAAGAATINDRDSNAASDGSAGAFGIFKYILLVGILALVVFMTIKIRKWRKNSVVSAQQQ